jgi:Asp-tRNA(Asn)/Glu-tRNA(Gln) amidotransferase A subunit family amidase
MLLALTPVSSSAQAKKFQLQEATIDDIHGALQDGQITCKGLVQAYINRAKAYNGVCTALVTKDGASIPKAKGVVRAGKALEFPTKTVAAKDVLPDLDQYQGLPIEYGRVEPTLSDPSVQQQYGMRIGMSEAGQLNALETINIRGERSVSCKAKCDLHPSKGALPASCPKACDEFRKQPDALERAAELDAQYGTKPDLQKLPMYCVVFSWKNWFDAKDMRATGGNDINFAMDAPKYDSPDVADLRSKGAISFAVAAASSTGTSSRTGPAKPKAYLPNGNFQDAAWSGQPCNPYDTSRVPRGTSNGSGISVSANLVDCSICEQSSASCKGPASRNNVVNLLTTKGILQNGGPGYEDSGDRAGIHCRTVGDAVKVLDAIKGYESGDMFTAIPKSLIPKEPYASFLVADRDVPAKPLKGMRLAMVREFMVKHVKNDAAISDQLDKEIKAVLRDRLGADLVESVDPLYPDDPTVPNLKYTFQDAFAEILPHNAPEYFWLTTGNGELEFAVPGWDVRTVDYLMALTAGKAPLSDKINLRRISGDGLANPESPFIYNKYLAARGDERVKDWASWVANSKWKSDAQRVGAENVVGDNDPRPAADEVSYLKMQAVLRMVVLKVMYENGIDAFVNPEHTLPPHKLGGAGEPAINNRATNSCCAGFTALLGGPEIDVPAGYTRVIYEPWYALTADKKRYEALTGDVQSLLPHPMPISLMVWSAPGSEPAVIKAASAFESATHHRKPPPSFGPVKGEP